MVAAPASTRPGPLTMQREDGLTAVVGVCFSSSTMFRAE
jgi:hypothetical protein